MINIRSTIQKGFSHSVFCQDATFSYQDEDLIVAGVFDGCSEVKDSHFASTFSTKILRKTVNEYVKIKNSVPSLGDNEISSEEYDIEKISLNLLREFFINLKKTQLIIDLIPNDLATTSILMFYLPKSDKGIIYVFGDGFLQINDDMPIIIDHDNKPRYATLYWKELTGDIYDFYNFMENYDQKWSFSELNNIVLSTDGILSFKNKKDQSLEKQYVIDQLTNDFRFKNLDLMLSRKYNYLCEEENWKNSDDLGIVRIFKTDEEKK